MQRIKKGEYGYVAGQKKWVSVKTTVLFLLSLAIYLSGYITTGSNKNLLTIVAVLGCLPAGKSAVNMIMFLRARGCDGALHEKIAAHAGDLPALYDCVLTTYENTFEVPHMVFKGNSLIGIAVASGFKTAECEKHLRNMCTQNGIRDVNIRIFTDVSRYLQRLDQLQELNASDDQTEAVLSLIRAISI